MTRKNRLTTGATYWLPVLLLLVSLRVWAQVPFSPLPVALPIKTAAGGPIGAAAMAADDEGNVYLAGHLKGEVAFGNLAFSHKGQFTTYVAKWLASTRQFAWVAAVAESSELEVSKLAVSGKSVYLAGAFQGKVKLGPATLQAAGQKELFIAKLTDLGATARVAWAQQSKGPAHHLDQLNALAVQGANVYVAGAFHAAMSLGDTTLVSRRFSDGFIAKLLDAGPTGRFVWARQLTGDANDYCNALAVAGPSVYIAGSITGDAQLMGFDLERKGSAADMFVAKLHDGGLAARVVWAKQLGGETFGVATAIAVQDSSLYVAGYCSHTLGFGEFRTEMARLTNPVVMKLRDRGTTMQPVWAWQAAATEAGYAEGIGLHGHEVYVQGTFYGSLACDTLLLKSAGARDIFLLRLADEGKRGYCTGGRQVGDCYNDEANAFLVTPEGLVYITADISRKATPTEQTAGTLPAVQTSQTLLLKLPH